MLKQDDDEPLLVYPLDHNPILLTLPDGGKIRSIQEAVSPDGKWIAFFTGSDKSIKPNLTLNLLDLADGSVQTITPVLTEGFPENMRPVAEYTDQVTPDDPNGISISVEGWMQLLEGIFPEAVMGVAWSPDSRSLAFSAQIDGPSADVYVYHLDTGKIQRMVDDIYTAFSIQWSPDGNWLLYSNDIPSPNYSARTLSVIRAGGPLVHQPKYFQNSPWWAGKGWINNNQYLITGQGDGGDPHRLQVINVGQGTITDIWRDTYFAYAYDSGRQLFFVCGYTAPKSEREQPRSDLFAIRLNGQKSVTGEHCFATAEYVGWGTTRFIGRGPNGVVAIDTNGKMAPLYEQDEGKLSVSPDRKWVALYNTKEIALFQEPGRLARTIPLNGISAILWSPDSSGLWINADASYFLPIPDGALVKLAACPLAQCWMSEHSYVWLH